MEDKGSIVIYESEGGDVRLDVRLENGTVWLTQEQLSVLFSKSVSTINYHINNIFREGELNKEEVFRIIRITTPHGAIEGLTQQSDLFLYNLKVIIAVGYRDGRIFKAKIPFIVEYLGKFKELIDDFWKKKDLHKLRTSLCLFLLKHLRKALTNAFNHVINSDGTC